MISSRRRVGPELWSRRAVGSSRRVFLKSAVSLFSLMTFSLVMLLGFGSTAQAHFENMHTGARSTAFGRAYSAVADDASASFHNPAALAAMSRSEVLLNYAKPYNIEGLQSAFAAAALPRDDVSLGLYWHHNGVADVISENLVGLALSRDLLAPGGDFALAAGAALKLANVSYSQDRDVDYGSETQFTFDASTMLNYTERYTFSIAAYNVIEPEFDFVSGNGGTVLKRRFDLGAAAQWHPESKLAVAISQNDDQDWRLHLGGEVWFHNVFSIRSGFVEGSFAGGIGLKTGEYIFDFSFLTDEALGASYEASFRLPFGESRW